MGTDRPRVEHGRSIKRGVMARGISLHIGLNSVDPDHYDGWDGALTACEFDANDMQSLAQSRGFETNKLLTQNATAAAVTAGIENAAKKLDSGDIFFITYSGHGGQVPDKNDEEESDSSDETWLNYDRQLVDDELYALWATFKPGVRIVVLSDSCHSGTVNRGIDDRESVPDEVATAEEAAKQSPRYRALPRDKMVATYEQNQELYDGIQRRVASSTSSEAELGGTVLLISGCKDDELSADGFSNGRFTEELLKVWDNGAWKGSYPAFHEAILAGMPEKQHPNYNPVGAANPEFEQQDPFTIG
jgi:metacaspase-1